MDYKLISEDLLKRKNEMLNAMRSLTDEIEMLESEKYSAHTSALSDTTVAKGGGSRYEERLVNLIVLTENSIERKKSVERDLKRIDNGFKILNEYETDLLETFFVYKRKNPVEKIAEKYFRERTSIYEDRQKALEKFTRGAFGIINL